MKRILLVDDNKENLVMLKAILEGEYKVTPILSGRLALEYLEKKDTDLILLDVEMPEMSGLEVIEKIKSNERSCNIPVLFLTGVNSSQTEVECLTKGGDDYITKPYDPIVLKRRISRLLELYELRFGLESALVEKSRQLDRMTLSTIITIANTVDAKDKYTGGHSLRVAVCSRDIAKNLGWSAEEVQNVYNVALLHDIGKIAVPDSVLNKPDRLTDEEFEIIKQHPVTGNEILRDITILEHVQEGAHFHHERWDGRGYPCGLAGKDIPVYARIIAIADSYDAMRSNRVYRNHLSTDKIISEFDRCKGSQFDPELADVFIFMLRSGYDIDPELVNSKESSMNADMEVHSMEEIASIKMGNKLNDNADTQDFLTGLFSRSYLNVKVGNKIMSDRCGTLMLLDIDNFYDVNSKFGHLEGDRLLKLFASQLTNQFGSEDIVCRLSGDEFAVFISGEQSREDLRVKAQRVIDGFRRGEYASKYENMLSVSIGISSYPKDGITFEELYGAADKALYHGKQNGIGMYHFYGNDSEEVVLENTKEDMKFIKNMIEGQFDNGQGALSVDYSDFQNIYNYVYRYVDRNDNNVQVILFTLRPDNGKNISLSFLEQAMHNLDLAVVESLRRVDVGTRYSSNQYIVILTDTDETNGTKVATRVIDQYYKIAGKGAITLAFDIETLEPNKNLNQEAK